MLRLLTRTLGGFRSGAAAAPSPTIGLADASGAGSSAAACASLEMNHLNGCLLDVVGHHEGIVSMRPAAAQMLQLVTCTASLFKFDVQFRLPFSAATEHRA